MILAQWDRRIKRANDLTSSLPFAAEGLRFYTRVATFQKDLYAIVQQSFENTPKISSTEPLQDSLDLFLLLPQFSGFLAAIQQAAPPPLAQAAAALSRQGSAAWQQAIQHFWHGAPDSAAFADDQNQTAVDDLDGSPSPESVLAWIFLQPYAECLADQRKPFTLDGTPFTCPLCGSRPIVGVLRSEGDGAKKSLVCMLCSHEWAFRRVYCPACGEEREPQMAFYSAPEIAHVRVDVCDTCHTYLKSVDLTKTGLAVPVVDELATIPLDLWAREHGYHKLQINMLGT